MVKENKDCEMTKPPINDKMPADEMPYNEMTEFDIGMVLDHEDEILSPENEDCDADDDDVDIPKVA